MQYIEYTLRPTPFSETATDLISALLGEVGFESFVTEEEQLKAYVQASLHDAEAVAAILADFPMPEVAIDYHYAEAENRDWNEEWEKNFFQPIVIGERCCIHSTFHHDTPQVEYDIIINPQMAFGTGHHETTGLIISRTKLIRYNLLSANALATLAEPSEPPTTIMLIGIVAPDRMLRIFSATFGNSIFMKNSATPMIDAISGAEIKSFRLTPPPLFRRITP